MSFTKYMHLERIGTSEVEGIEIGRTYIFPKLDGTNASVWQDEEGNIKAGSRNRELTCDNDNAGFCKWVGDNKGLFERFFDLNPDYTLYGEWLVPHSLKTYQDDAWRNFYVFDVYNRVTEKYIPYEDYADVLKGRGIAYLSPITIFDNGTIEHFMECLDKNTVFIKDGEGVGEGVVVKNYDFVNKYGRVVWGKLITNSFQQKHNKEMGAPIIGPDVIEQKIVEKYVTDHLVRKVHAKLITENDGWTGRLIPQLLGVVWHDLITEEIWDILKTNKNPKIDFGYLNRLTIAKTKELLPEVF